MSQIPDPREWPSSSARTITVHEPTDGYKAPIGFVWPEQEEPKGEKPSADHPSTGSGGTE